MMVLHSQFYTSITAARTWFSNITDQCHNCGLHSCYRSFAGPNQELVK